MDHYYAAACQTDFPSPAERGEIAAHVRRMCAMAEQTIVGYEPFHDVRLLAFPEFAHSPPAYPTVAALRDKLAVELPNEHTDAYQRLCAQYGCYIQTGTFLELDPEFPEAVFNTTLLIGPDGVLSKYRKVNTWIPWEVHTSPHDLGLSPEQMFPVVDTEIGRIGAAICYDWLFPEPLRQLRSHGAEILIRVSAYMDPWGATAPMDWWTLFNRTRAIENQVFVVAANQGAAFEHYPPFSWPGGSMVVDFDGRILAQADPGPGEKVVVAPIDLAALRRERERRQGHDMFSHARHQAYNYHQQPGLAAAPAGEVISCEQLRQRIAQAKSDNHAAAIGSQGYRQAAARTHENEADSHD